MCLRWMVEPYGMWDAWALWNLKAKTITNEFIFSNRVHFTNTEWHHRDYPLAIPLIHSSIAIILGQWTEGISYFIQILFYSTIGFFFILYANYKKFHFAYLLFPLLILAMNSQYLNIASDLCSEMALSCVLVMIYYAIATENEFVKNKSLFKMGLLFASPIIIKNEGLIHSIIILSSFSIFLFFNNSKFIAKRIIILSLPFLFLVMVVLLWKYSGNQLLPRDFIQTTSSQKMNLELIFSKLPFILIYLKNFHYSMMNGIFFIAIISALVVRKPNFLILCIHTLFISIAYNLVFIFSTPDISWHLHTAYVRIHSALIAPVIFLAWISLTTLMNNK